MVRFLLLVREIEKNEIEWKHLTVRPQKTQNSILKKLYGVQRIANILQISARIAEFNIFKIEIKLSVVLYH